MNIQTIVEHEGQTFNAQIATVERANLGFEDHGILSWNLSFSGPSWGQGTGHRALGTGGYFTSLLPELLRVFAVGDWSEIVGKKVFVLRSGNQFGQIEGVASLDGSEVFLVQQHAAKFYAGE